MLTIVLRPDETLDRDQATDPASTDPLAALAASARMGDRDALRTLLVSVTPSLMRVVRGMIGAGNPDVDDVVQEAAIGIVRSLPTFRGECTVLHFGCRIAVLCTLAARRRTAAHARSDRHGAEESVATESTSPSRLALDALRRDEVRSLLEALPEAQAEVLALHCMLGLTVEEIASATSVPFHTARSRLRLAKEALRAQALRDPLLRDKLEIES